MASASFSSCIHHCTRICCRKSFIDTAEIRFCRFVIVVSLNQGGGGKGEAGTQILEDPFSVVSMLIFCTAEVNLVNIHFPD